MLSSNAALVVEVERRQLLVGGKVAVGDRKQGFHAHLAVRDDLFGGHVHCSLQRGLAGRFNLKLVAEYCTAQNEFYRSIKACQAFFVLCTKCPLGGGVSRYKTTG